MATVPSYMHTRNWDSWLSVMWRYWLDSRGSILHRVQTGSGPPASYSMGTRGFFPEGKAAVAWSWQLTSI
jgi:hypothetical protein